MLLFLFHFIEKGNVKGGYNQVSLFGKTIAHYLGVPFIENVLVRTQNTKQLAKKFFGIAKKYLKMLFVWI